MAIDPITLGDEQARAKVNAAIDKANQVDSKAPSALLANEVASRLQSVASLDGKIATERTARQGEAAALDGKIATERAVRQAETVRLERRQVGGSARPGDNPGLFSPSLAGGDPVALPVFGTGAAVNDDSGAVLRFTGPGVAASVEYQAIEIGRTYRMRYKVQRRVTPTDPANHTVRFAVAWFDQNKLPLGGGSAFTTVEDINNLVAGGAKASAVFMARAAGTGIAIVAPAAARYARAYVQVFGDIHRTDVEIVEIVDVTDAQAWSPDLTTFDSRLGAVESAGLPDRVDLIEAALDAPVSYTLPDMATLEETAVPVTVDIVRLLGFDSATDGKGGEWGRTSDTDGSTHLSADGARWKLVPAAPSLLQHGGRDDGTGDNQAIVVKAVAGGQVRLPLPKKTDGEYRFAVADLRGVELDPEPGVKVSGNVLFYPEIETAKNLPIAYDDGGADPVAYDYEFASYFNRDLVDKWSTLTAGDLPDARRQALNVATLAALVKFDPTTQANATFTADASAGLSASGAGWTLTTPDGLWHAALLPVHGGQDLRWAWAGVDLLRAAVIEFTEGLVLFAVADSGAATLIVKPFGGVMASYPDLSWLGNADHLSWQGRYAEMGVRFYDETRWAVLMNGVEVTLIQNIAGLGDIVRAGPAVFSTVTNNANAMSIHRVRREQPAGLRPVQLLLLGDSRTDPSVHGNWTHVCREMLDGFSGARVINMLNYAVSGDTSFAQRARLVSQGLAGATDVYIEVGANDIVQSVPIENFIAEVGAMIDFCQAGGARVVIGITDLWYPKSLVGGAYGFETLSYQRGAPYRSALARLADEKGAGCVDLCEEVGAVLANWRNANDGWVDPIMRDNIHHTAYGYRLKGEAIARAIGRNIARRMTEDVTEKPLPSRFSNSWAIFGDATERPRYSIRDGVCTLTGIVGAGTAGTPVTIYTLPQNLHPARPHRFPVLDSNGGVRLLTVSTTGVLSLNFAAGPAWISLAGVSFALA